MSLGDNIKKARINKGMTQKQLSEKLNVAYNSISNWENSVSKPDPDTILLLCNILDVDANYLLDFNSKKNDSLQDSNERYKQILINKGIMDEKGNIDEESFNKLIKIADIMNEMNKKE